MARHPKNIEGFDGTHSDLAKAVGNMAYDEVSDVIGELAAEFQRQAEADESRDRPRLASRLYAAACALIEAQSAIDEAWKISEPYMTDE